LTTGTTRLYNIKISYCTSPDAPIAHDVAVCSGSQATLVASGGGEYDWFADEFGNHFLGTGQSFQTPALTNTTTYYVGAKSSFFITEICHWRGATTGAPSGGWPSYLIADDYIEITGPPNGDLSGYVLEMWSTSALNNSQTLSAGTVLSPQGTAIIATGQLGTSTPSPSDYYYHSGFTGSMGSGTAQGYILKDINGDIVDAAGYRGTSTGYTFPAAAGVTTSHWSGTVPASGSTAGIRLEGEYTRDAANWISSATNPQDPNEVNADVAVPCGYTFSSSYVGPQDNTIGTTSSSTLINHFLIFDVLNSELTIKSVDVIPAVASGSNYTIVIQDASQTVIFTYSGTTSVASGDVETVEINATLPQGNGYRMGFNVNPSMWRNTTGASFPYTIDDVISITGNTFDPSYYYYFYNWKVDYHLPPIVCENIFYTNFENGNVDDFCVSAGTQGVLTASTEQARSGSWSGKLTGGGTHYTGAEICLNAEQPTEISFWIYPTSMISANSYFTIQDGTTGDVNSQLAMFYYNTSSGGALHTLGSSTVSVIASLNTWHHVEYKNIDWTAGTFDVYYNGILEGSAIGFRGGTSVNKIDRVFLYHYSGSITGYYDDIRIGGECYQGSPCYSELKPVTVTVGQPGLWTGLVDTDWNNVGNWSCAIPDETVDVVIPAGCPNYPVLTGNIGVGTGSYPHKCAKLTINSGANMTIGGNHIVYLHADMIINGDFTQNASSSNNFRINSGGFLQINGGNTYIGNDAGTWKYADIYINSGGRMEVNGGNLYVDDIIRAYNGGAVKITGGNVYVKYRNYGSVGNGMDVQSGSLFEMSGGDLHICGSSSFTTGNQGLYFDPSATVNITGGNIVLTDGILATQYTPYYVNFGGHSIHNLIVDKPTSNVSALNSDAIINGNFSIVSGVFNVATTITSYDMYVRGNWTNNGTFEPENGTVVMNGTASQSINNGSGTWNNLTLSGSSHSFQSSMDINGNFTWTSGGLYVSAGQHHSVAGDFVQTGGGGGGYSINASWTFDGTNQEIFANGNHAYIYGDFIIGPTSTTTIRSTPGNYVMNWGDDCTVHGVMYLSDNSFYRSVSNPLNMRVFGELRSNSSLVNMPKIAGNGSSFPLSIQVESGGRVNLNGCIFDYLGTNGLRLLSGSIVDRLDNCQFDNAANAITISNTQSFYIEDPVFNSTITTNVNKTNATGNITICSGGGDKWGPAFENDVNNRVKWGGNPSVTNDLLYTWNGSSSTNWNTASNWTIVDADCGNYTPANPPNETNDVVIPAGCLNYPAVTSAMYVNNSSGTVKCKSILIQNGASVNNSSQLHVYGNMTVDGTYTGTQNLSNNNTIYTGGVVTLTGTMSLGNISSNLSDLRVFDGGSLAISGSGHLIVGDQFDVFGGGTFTMTSGRLDAHAGGGGSSFSTTYPSKFYIRAGANGGVSGGTITVCGRPTANNFYAVDVREPSFTFSTNSTIELRHGLFGTLYNGEIHAVPGVQFGQITINKTGNTVNLASNIDVQNRVSVQSGTLDANGYDLDIVNSIPISAGAKLHVPINSNVTVTSTGTGYNLDGELEITGGNFVTYPRWHNHYGTIRVSSGKYECAGNTNWCVMGVNTHWELSGGEIRFSGSTYPNFTSSFTQNITGGTIYFACDIVNEFPASFTPSGGTVEFYGTSNTNIRMNSSARFHHLVVNKNAANTLTLQNNITVNANLTINNGVFNAGASNNIFLAGNWTNNATFEPENGTVFINGTAAQALNTGGQGAGKEFYNLVVNKSSGTATLGNPLKITNDFTLTTGFFDVSTSNHAISVNRNWTITGGTFTHRSGTVWFEGNINSDVNSGGEEFYNFRVNKDNMANIVRPVGSNILIFNILTVSGGTLRDNGRNVEARFGGTHSIMVRGNNARILVDGGGSIGSATLNGRADVCEHGTVEVSNGTFYVNWAAVFGNASGPGFLNISGNGLVDIYKEINGWSTGMGLTMTGGRFRIGQDFFSISYNVVHSWNVTGGTIELYPGHQTSSTFRTTTGAPIHFHHLEIASGKTMATNRNLNVRGDWINDGSFTPSTYTVFFEAGNATLYTGGLAAGKVFNNVEVNASGTKTLAGNLGVNNNITFNTGTFDVSTSNHAVNIGGNWENNATFVPRNGRVTFSGSNNAAISGSATTILYEMTLDKGSDISTVLEVLSSVNITRAATTSLEFTNGLLSIEPGGIVYITSGKTITSTSGLQLNGGVLSASGGTIANDGYFRLASGTANIGSSAGNSLQNRSGSKFYVENGTMNIAGRLEFTAGTGGQEAEITGGTINLCVNGNSAGNGAFNMVGTSNILISGNPLITFDRASTSATPVDLRIFAGTGTKNIIGGTFRFGIASTPASQTFRVHSEVPLHNIEVFGHNNPSALLVNEVLGSNNITIHSGGTLNANNLPITIMGDWTNNGTFVPTSETVTFGGTTQQTVHAGASAFNSLKLDNATGLLLTTDLIVGDGLNMTSGNIFNNGNLLTVGLSALSPGEIKYTSGSIVGTLRRWFDNTTYTGELKGLFPLGVEDGVNVLERHMLVEYTAAPSGGTLTARFEESAMEWQPPHLSPTIPLTGSCPEFKVTTYSDEGYWDVTEGNGMSGGTYDIQLTGEGIQSISVVDFCQLTALRRQGLGNWEVPVGSVHLNPTGTVAKPIVRRTNVSEWSNWGFAGGGDNALPVELVHFAAECTDNGILLQWTTASEQNNDYFILEKSENGIDFQSIAIINGSGTTNAFTHYEHLYHTPSGVTEYFRIVQLDYDGTPTTYSPVSVRCGSSQATDYPSIQVYPNPFTDYVTVVLQKMDESPVLVELYDKMGKLLWSEQMEISKENKQFVLHLSHLSMSVYELRVSNQRHKLNARIVKQ
jgi:hypothetical protein